MCSWASSPSWPKRLRRKRTTFFLPHAAHGGGRSRAARRAGDRQSVRRSPGPGRDPARQLQAVRALARYPHSSSPVRSMGEVASSPGLKPGERDGGGTTDRHRYSFGNLRRRLARTLSCPSLRQSPWHTSYRKRSLAHANSGKGLPMPKPSYGSVCEAFKAFDSGGSILSDRSSPILPARAPV